MGPGWWLASDGRWYPPADAIAPATPQAPPRKPYNGQAIASLVLGIVSLIWGIYLFPVLATLAIVFGMQARRGAERLGWPRNGMATAGLTMGIISAALYGGVWLVIIVAAVVA